MPIYEYKCTKCEHEFELLCKMGETEDKECSQCGGITKRKVASKVGLKFKGDGFYINDYKNKKSSSNKNEEAKEHIQAKSSDCSACACKAKNNCSID